MNLDFPPNPTQKPIPNVKSTMKLMKKQVPVKVKQLQKLLKKRKTNKVLNDDSHY